MYDQGNAKVITLGFTLVLAFVASSIFVLLHSTFTIGIYLFATNRFMARFWEIVMKVGFSIFHPAIMIGFEVLLMYGLFYGKSEPVFVTAVLGFFILMLGLAICGYWSNISRMEPPKMRRIGTGRWASDWYDTPQPPK